MRSRVVQVVSLLLSLMVGMASAAAKPDQTDIDLVLEQAVFRGDKASADDGPAIVLHTVQTGDAWGRTWCIAGDFITGWHPGVVTKGTLADDKATLSISTYIQGDAWVKGGRGKYDVTLEKQPDGTYAGTFTGTFRGGAVQGPARALITPRTRLSSGFELPESGEHPRLLFRKGDLKTLRKKAETEFGKAAVAKMKDAIGLGMKYQLTGDKQFAEQAWTAIEKEIGNLEGGDKIQRGRALGQRSEQIALAYDFCYDAWTPEQRRACEVHMVGGTEAAYQWASTKIHGQIHNHIAGPHLGSTFYGMSLGSLAIWGEKGPAPGKPALPTTEEMIPPADDYKPGKDVPVVPLEPGKSPSEWLVLGPANLMFTGDPLADSGGVGDCRPEVGTQGAFGDVKLAFKVMDPKHAAKDGGIVLKTQMDGDGSWSGWFYTVVESRKEQLVKVENPFGRAGTPVMVLNGRHLLHKQVVKLGKGKYPMLVGFALSLPWEMLKPALLPATDADVEASKAMMAAKADEINDALADWRLDKAQWDAMGGANVEYLKTFELNRFGMYMLARERVGTGGFQWGAPSVRPMDGPNRYFTCYRNVMGLDVSPFNDVTYYIPRKMCANLYTADGKAKAQTIVGYQDFNVYEYVGSKHDEAMTFFGAMFPIVPDPWKRAALWAWHYYAGVKDNTETERIKVLDRAHPVYTFVNYPLNMEPEHPSKSMPLNWEAVDHGYYCFRNSWEGKEEFIVQLLAKTKTSGGTSPDNAGAYRVMGLGKEWITGGQKRMFENVVQLPDDDINEDALGKVTYAKLEKDGSGVVTIDLNDVYATARTTQKGQAKLYEKHGGVRCAKSFADSGITGLRAFGVDYSGKSGAPCLVVLVDKIEGGKKKLWALPFASGAWGVGKFQMENVDEVAKGMGYAAMTKKYYKEMMQQVEKWKLPGDRGRESPYKSFADMREATLKTLQMDGNTFTITKGDATLRGTFVTPKKVKLSTDDLETMHMGAKRTILYAACAGLFATGGDEYLCVMTIQKGDPPEVKVKGKGLDAVVTVGEQTVTFDGEKIIFGK